MKFDYHMHLEYGDYDENWVQGFFDAAKTHGLDEIGFSEHTHTFPEFEHFYYDDLILDESPTGLFQRGWLKKINSSIRYKIISISLRSCKKITR